MNDVGGMDVRFSFSSSGEGAWGGGMDAARASKMFEAFFGSGDDTFGLMGGVDGLMGGMGGLRGGMPSMTGIPRRPARTASATAFDVLPPGTPVKLAGLSDPALAGAVGTIDSFDRQKHRYTVSMTAGNMLSVRPTNVQQIVSDATVIGTSQAQLNGRVAASATYDAGTKRYRVEGLTPDGKTIALRPENLVLPERTQVTIDGVQSRPALNGKRGRIINVDTAANRYTVATSDEQLRLRFGTVVAAC